jgi:high-affinity iron transporter
MTASNVFAVPVFLVVFRETLETAIIVSILLAFIKQTLDGPDGDKPIYKTLRRQVCLSNQFTWSVCFKVN